MRPYLLALLLAASCFGAGKKSDVQWNSRYEAARELAEKSRKPLLIEFWASWCGPCKRMDQESWPDSKVVTLSSKFVCVSVDADRDQDTAARFHVNALPTVVVADPWAGTLRRREGYLHAAELAGMMEDVPPDFSAARESHDALARNSKDGVALARMGQFFVKANSLALGNQYYLDALKSKECKGDLTLRCELLLAIGMDDVALHEWNDARKYLRLYLTEFPDAPQRDRALLALVFADVRQGKRGDAEKSFAELKEKFPLSSATQSAERILKSTK